MATFNGHKNWNHWNVSLWINNDEGLCNLARECIKEAPASNYVRHGYRPRDAASFLFMARIHGMGIYTTPDGGIYNQTAVRAAMVGM